MGKYKRLLAMLLCVGLVSASVAFIPSDGFSYVSQSPQGCAQGAANGQCNTCVSSQQYQIANATGIGQMLIQAVFSAINGLLAQISANFYQNIIGNLDFQAAVNTAVLMYVTIYGVLIMFGLAKVHTASEPVARLFKIALVWAIINPTTGWTFFSTYVGNLFLGGMNELISQFQTAAGGTATVVAVTDAAGGITVTLDYNAVSSLFTPMNTVFAAKFMVAILSLLTTGPAGWLLGGLLAWSFIEFIFMIIGAIATYVKSLVGLAFLFGISPIFFACILFEKTRQVFMGWLNEVAAFSLQPVLLFGFLAFYLSLMNTVLTAMLPTTLDFCWLTWFSIPNIWDVSFWRPVLNGNMSGGAWADASGNPLAPPISVLNALYFLLLCSLGKNFCSYINQIASDLTQGLGPSVVTGDEIRGKLQNVLTGGKGPLGTTAHAGTSMMESLRRAAMGNTVPKG